MRLEKFSSRLYVQLITRFDLSGILMIHVFSFNSHSTFNDSSLCDLSICFIGLMIYMFYFSVLELGDLTIHQLISKLSNLLRVYMPVYILYNGR